MGLALVETKIPEMVLDDTKSEHHHHLLIEDSLNKKEESITIPSSSSAIEKHKLITLIQEQDKSPMDSPMTDSGAGGLTDYTGGTSTGSGKIRNKPTTLDCLDSSNIDTEGDLSEMSPANDLVQDDDVLHVHVELVITQNGG